MDDGFDKIRGVNGARKICMEIHPRFVFTLRVTSKRTYAFVDASLEIEILEFAVRFRVLLLQRFDTNGASIQSLLEAHATRLALHTELSGNLTLFHDYCILENCTAATDQRGGGKRKKKSRELRSRNFKFLRSVSSPLMPLITSPSTFAAMEIIPSGAIMIGCWCAVAGLTRAVLWVSNDRVRVRCADLAIALSNVPPAIDFPSCPLSLIPRVCIL